MKEGNEVARARATPGHRWSSPKKICVPSSPSWPYVDRGHCPSYSTTCIPRLVVSHEFWSRLGRRLRSSSLSFLSSSLSFFLSLSLSREGDPAMEPPGIRVSPRIVENRISMDDDNVCGWSSRVPPLGERGGRRAR